MENNVIDVKFNEQKECLPLIFKSIGPEGPQGPAGKSAYEQAVEAGYTGTEEEFNSLVFNAKNYAEEAKQSAEESAAATESAVSTHNQSNTAHADIRTALSGKAEQTALEAHTADTDNPHAVTKAQVGLGNVDNTADTDKPISSAVQAALERKQDDDDFHPEDYGWPDIRPAARPNAIVLLAGVKADYSAYDNLGFIATCEGGYNVFIDGVQYGDTYASGEQCSITWSQYSAMTGFPVTQPEALTAHIVQIVPATDENNLTTFLCARVASSGTEQQGVLWAHVNFEQAVNVSFYTPEAVNTPMLTAVTVSGNTLKINSSINFSFANCPSLAYVPVLDGENRTIYGGQTFNTSSSLKKVHFKNMKFTNLAYTFYGASALEKVIFQNVDTSACKLMSGVIAKVKNLPYVDFTAATDCNELFSGGTGEMNPFMLDTSYANNVTRFGVSGISELLGLLVSKFAPFTGSSPQINVSNTGLDRNALVALFNSLPYNVGYTVVGSPTIQDGMASGFSLSDYLTIPSMPKISLSDTLEIVFDITTSSSLSNTEHILISGGWGQLYQNWNKSMGSYFNGKYFSGNTILENSSRHQVKYLFSKGTLKLYLDDTLDGETEVGEITKGGQTALASRPGLNYFSGIIHTATSYIKYNGMPYFKWIPAMEKTINITGAVGAAELTAEDLALATNKGWTVTR